MKKILIKGVTLEGKTFRPSNWIDRLCASGAKFNESHRLVYSDYLYPVMVESKRCLFVDEELAKDSPEIYQHVMNFIKRHRLTFETLSEDDK